MRRVHRTVVARFFAACLLLLAASPLTAPFTTCDLSDFTHSDQPSNVPPAGHQMAVPDYKVALDLKVTPPPLPHLVTGERLELRRLVLPLTLGFQPSSTRPSVLRV